jgi:serine protease AprX
LAAQRGRAVLVVVVVATAAGVVGGAVEQQAVAAGPRAAVIVTMSGGDPAGVARIVARAGGRVGRQLPLVHGFTAVLPVAAVPAVAALTGVRSVTADAGGRLLSVDPALGYDQGTDEGSLSWLGKMLGVPAVWSDGVTGKGVDVALVDSGVARVPGLVSGNVVDGPDLSFESQHADVRYLDTFGHGTHMASIIAGRDTAGTPASYAASGQFDGIAPDARIISVKVAAADGAADVSQVIAAIDWVAQHAHTDGLNIRVLNLSYGTDSTQSSVLDPLSYAVEQAWRRGIVVVVAAGNDGTTRAALADPASNPYVLAVGADEPNNTLGVKDDTVPAFAQRGTTARHVDVIAPGVHVLGLRVPNSYVDQNNPAGRVGTRFIRGSGTSQATAVVSGVAALVLQKYPTATPDQVKYLVMTSATKFSAGNTGDQTGQHEDLWQGLGIIDAAKAVGGKPSAAPVQSFPVATGSGLLEGSRGSSHVVQAAVTLAGEKDIFGRAWTAATWSAAVAANTAWSGGSFNGCLWSGTTWATSTRWAAATWTGTDWTGTAWSTPSWVSRTWVNSSWDSRTWVASTWDSRTWVGATWAGAAWR